MLIRQGTIDYVYFIKQKLLVCVVIKAVAHVFINKLKEHDNQGGITIWEGLGVTCGKM